jgi:hypothetical protein
MNQVLQRGADFHSCVATGFAVDSLRFRREPGSGWNVGLRGLNASPPGHPATAEVESASMARIRTVKPGFTQHEELSSLPAETHLLAVGILCYADDEGYFNANPKLVQASVFPVRELSSTVPVMLQELSDIGWLKCGTGSDGRRYGQVVNFSKHQVISHPRKSEIASVVIKWDTVENTIPEVSSNPPITLHPEGKGKEVEGKGREEETAPPDLHPLKYAAGLMEKIQMPETQSNLRTVAAAIKSLMSDKSGPAAYEFLLAKVLDAIDQGVTIDKFWFEDCKWRQNSKQPAGKLTGEQILDRELKLFRAKQAD